VRQSNNISNLFGRSKIEVTKIRACILKSIRHWLDRNGYLEISTPVIVSHPIVKELAFKLNYFEREAFVSHNNQLYLEKAALSMGNSWTINPSFRSERKPSERHLSEFTLLQLECLNLKSLDNVLQMEEELVSHSINSVLLERLDSLGFLKIDISRLKHVRPPFDRMHYNEAIEFLRNHDFKAKGNKRTIEWGDELDIDAEKKLTQKRTTPLFVTHFPMSLRPFYIMHDTENEQLSVSVDMLAPQGFGEITSGGLREDNIQNLRKELKIRYGNNRTFAWYCNLKKQKLSSHGGFGLGIDRFVRWITNSRNIRDVVLYPRTESILTP